MNKIYIIIAILILAVGAIIVSSMDKAEVDVIENTNTEVSTENNVPNPNNSVENPVVGGYTPPPTGGETPAPVKTFEVVAKNFSFSPSVISVKRGDIVRVTLINENGNHDLVINDFNAKTKILGAGETQTIEFIADKTGSFEYYCSVGSHRAMGMKGTLIVQ